MGEIISMITMRPVTFFILLTIGVLLLPSIVIPYWYHMMRKMEHNVEMEANHDHLCLVSKIEDTSKLIFASNSSSAAHLTSMLATELLYANHTLFSDIQTKVARILFEAQLIIPHVTQASYIGLDGLLFSYSRDGDRNYAIYSNSSFWYTQLASSESGALYGEVNITKPDVNIVNDAWFQRVMNSSRDNYASLGFQWTGDHNNLLFLDTARLDGVGAISLGFSAKDISNVFSGINLNAGGLFMATLFGGRDSYKVLLDEIKVANISLIKGGDKALVKTTVNNKGVEISVGEVSCKAKAKGATFNIGEINYIFHCSRIDIARVPSVYILASPSKKLVSNVEKYTKVALILLILMMVAILISIFAFVALIVRASRREMHLCAAYMREMQKTAQAERKSMKQSLAFASANHDVRGYLTCIKGLIDVSSNVVPPFSDIASNLNKMDRCSEDLLALVNSILDFSKIEAGKMQLEDTEFNLVQLLEDIADLHYPVAMKKGVDVVLDPCDGTVIKFSHVKGDRAKLKQILANLLSNAVKFTSDGHVSIRAWAKKPSLENSIIASNKNSLLNRLSSFFYKNKRAYNDIEEIRTVKQDPNCMEFEFQVEDTGPGIPKEKRQSIFENFVQVKENSAGQVGTGLGLGIVQSLVRLMGGDIEIVDKVNGEEGTCFKFNIFLIAQENAPADNICQEGSEFRPTHHGLGLTTTCTKNPRVEGSLVVLLIKNDERRRMVQRFMESLGIKLVVLRHVNQLPRALKRKIRPKLSVSRCYSSSSSGSLSGAYLSSCSDPCRGGPKLFPLSTMDGDEEVIPVYKRASFRGSVKCIMLVVDTNAGDFQELCRSVAEFRRDLYITSVKVVWLERPDTRGAHFSGLGNENLPLTDCIISEPLHGSRLFQVIALLPEFGGNLMRIPHLRTEQPGSSSSSENIDSVRKEATVVDIERTNNGKPFLGKKFLIAEDTDMLRKLTATLITRWGAYAHVCENGREAVEIISEALSKLTAGRASEFPYDCILMDCQMPEMNGFEATKRIREEEKKYGVHIPIIALTGYGAEEERKRIFEAGMDSYLIKPLKREELLEAMKTL